jgi:hypothetical protein
MAIIGLAIFIPDASGMFLPGSPQLPFRLSPTRRTRFFQ